MCFYTEADWTASVQDEKTTTAEKPTRCDECRCIIPAGGTVHHLFQQEHEECVCQYYGDAKEYGPDGECICEPPNFGETFEYDKCDECAKFLKAVELVEKEAGCPPDQRHPYLCQMIETIRDQVEPEDAKRYFKKALTQYPELQKSGYLGRIGKRIFA